MPEATFHGDGSITIHWHDGPRTYRFTGADWELTPVPRDPGADFHYANMSDGPRIVPITSRFHRQDLCAYVGGRCAYPPFSNEGDRTK